MDLNASSSDQIDSSTPRQYYLLTIDSLSVPCTFGSRLCKRCKSISGHSRMFPRLCPRTFWRRSHGSAAELAFYYLSSHSGLSQVQILSHNSYFSQLGCLYIDTRPPSISIGMLGFFLKWTALCWSNKKACTPS